VGQVKCLVGEWVCKYVTCCHWQAVLCHYFQAYRLNTRSIFITLIWPVAGQFQNCARLPRLSVAVCIYVSTLSLGSNTLSYELDRRPAHGCLGVQSPAPHLLPPRSRSHPSRAFGQQLTPSGRHLETIMLRKASHESAISLLFKLAYFATRCSKEYSTFGKSLCTYKNTFLNWKNHTE
jgi:hypothetical protein